jgi:Kdo2-lipid IVA lauroyltransferase/acyltransferase
MRLVFKCLSFLPLWLLHALGWVLGWLAFLSSATYRQRFLANAQQAGIAPADWRKAVGESGKLVAELPRLWLGAAVPVRWDGEAHVVRALEIGKGIIFLTPHLGCFEVTAQAYALRFGQGGQPITVLFRPPRKAWLARWVAVARTRPGMDTAPTTLAGVKQLLKALRAGQCVGLLPDQVPPEGQGVWLPFFQREAYTMTLSARLAAQGGATVLIAWGERLSWGRGYIVHVQPLSSALPSDLVQASVCINQAMEALIVQCPSQYLWGYARYKQPRSNE